MEFLQLEIITHIERNRALSLIKDLISKAGGWIVDHHLFSNNYASLSSEIPFISIDTFINDLRDAGLKPTIQGKIPQKKTTEVRCAIAITFVHNEPDMKRDVPPLWIN